MMEAKEKELIEKAGFSLKEFEAWNSIVNDYGLETKTPPPPPPPPPPMIYIFGCTHISITWVQTIYYSEMRSQVEYQLLCG